MGGLKPDHKTIAEFRRHHKQALQKVWRQCTQLCIKPDLIAGNVFFVDGTKHLLWATGRIFHKSSTSTKVHDFPVFYEVRV
jgi:transposase